MKKILIEKKTLNKKTPVLVMTVIRLRFKCSRHWVLELCCQENSIL